MSPRPNFASRDPSHCECPIRRLGGHLAAIAQSPKTQILNRRKTEPGCAASRKSDDFSSCQHTAKVNRLAVLHRRLIRPASRRHRRASAMTHFRRKRIATVVALRSRSRRRLFLAVANYIEAWRPCGDVEEAHVPSDDHRGGGDIAEFLTPSLCEECKQCGHPKGCRIRRNRDRIALFLRLLVQQCADAFVSIFLRLLIVVRLLLCACVMRTHQHQRLSSRAPVRIRATAVRGSVGRRRPGLGIGSDNSRPKQLSGADHF